MRSFVFILIVAFTSINLYAQPITGDWYGTLNAKKTKIHLVFHINRTANGYSTTMDSPDQGASGIKTDTTKVEGNNITIEIKSLSMIYTGSFDSTLSKCTGLFMQGPSQIPLVLTRTKEETKVVIRPQDPVDFPYYQEEVAFHNLKDSVTLAGTLTLPKDKKADKIVILITGSGPQNRNEELKTFNHRPFLVWSDWLTRHGIGVLRYDDRGIGNSTGDFSIATSADFAKDAEAAIDFIKSRSDLKEMQLGLMGHSEGGMIAPMVASKDSRVKFIVLLAGPGDPINELMLKQAENSQTAANTPKEIEDLNMQTAGMIYSYMKKHADEPNETIEPKLKKILTKQFAKYPADAFKGTTTDEVASRELKSYLGVWFRYFISFEPADYLEKVKCPVLAMNGTLDVQVDAKQNLPAIEAALKKGKNTHFEIVPMEGLNHLFQKAKTGNVDEYGEIAETVNPAALNKVTDWINK
ncbi:MAG: alpha/beta hydrolase family protein [Candidatus Babeliales bacterium]